MVREGGGLGYGGGIDHNDDDYDDDEAVHVMKWG
jgi:hypothetical protein